MKKKILFLLLSATSLMAIASPGEDVNRVVQEAFNARFGKTSAVEWRRVQGVYVGHFNMNGQEMDAYFNDDGELLGTGREIERNIIDEKTKATISKRFGEWDILQAYELTIPDESPVQFIFLWNPKFSAIIKVDQCGSIVQIQKKKIKSSVRLKKTVMANEKPVDMKTKPIM